MIGHKKRKFCHVSLIEEKSGSGSHRRVGGFHRLFRVKVLEIRGANVKLGFEVDADVPVHRAEVWERIQAAAGQNI